MKFRKKPITVDACRWFKNGDHPDDYANPRYDIFRGDTTSADRCKAEGWEGEVVRRFRRPDVDGDSMCRKCGLRMRDHGWIDTLEGGHSVCPGDWIITGVRGEHYPCKPDIFEATYEAEELLDEHDAEIACEAAKRARKEALDAAITCTYTLAAGEAVAWRIRCEFARLWPDDYDKEMQ